MEPVNVEELKQEFETLNSERKKLHEEEKQLYKQIRELQKLKNLQAASLKTCEKRMIEIQNILFTQNIFNEETMSKFTDFHLLSANDIKQISKGLDKTDYTKYGKPRIMDLENVVNFILRIKKLYPTWNLDLLQKTGQQDSLPPKNIYEYTFITPEGDHFIYGGLQVIYKNSGDYSKSYDEPSDNSSINNTIAHSTLNKYV